jgi:hypothetical protein
MFGGIYIAANNLYLEYLAIATEGNAVISFK